jgi:hypothetical protein
MVSQYVWLARSRPIRLLLLACCLAYAGDLAAFTAASVYVYQAGGAAYVGLLGLLQALPARCWFRSSPAGRTGYGVSGC